MNRKTYDRTYDPNGALQIAIPLLSDLSQDLIRQFGPIHARTAVDPQWIHYLVVAMRYRGLTPTQFTVATVITYATEGEWKQIFYRVGQLLAGYQVGHLGVYSTGPVDSAHHRRSAWRSHPGFRYADGPAMGGPGYAPAGYGHGMPGSYTVGDDYRRSTHEPLYRNPVDPYEPLPVGATPKEAMDWMGRVTGRKLAGDMRRPGMWRRHIFGDRDVPGDGMGSGTFEGTYGGAQPGYSTDEDLDRIHDPSNQRTSPEAFEARLKAQRAFMAETNPCDVLAHDEEFQNLWATLYSHGVQLIAQAGSSALEAAWDELNTARTQFEAARNEWDVQRNLQEAEKNDQGDHLATLHRFSERLAEDQVITARVPAGEDVVATYERLMAKLKQVVDGREYLISHIDLDSLSMPKSLDRDDRWAVVMELDKQFAVITAEQKAVIVTENDNLSRTIVLFPLDGKRHMLFLATEHTDEVFPRLRHLIDGGELNLSEDELMVEAWGSLHGLVHSFTLEDGIKVQAPEDRLVPTKEDERVHRYTTIVDRLTELKDFSFELGHGPVPFVGVSTLQALYESDPYFSVENDRHEIAGWLSRALRTPEGKEGPALFLIRDTRNGIPYVVVVPPDAERMSPLSCGNSVLYMDLHGDIKKYYGMFSLPADDLLDRLEKLLNGPMPPTADAARQMLSLTSHTEK